MDDARPTQHDKGPLSEGSSTVKKKKRKKRQPDHMKCNHVRSHATVGCHAHNQRAVGDGEMMEVPWILEQED